MPEQTARPNKPFESLISDEAREHYRTARREMRGNKIPASTGISGTS